MSPRLRLRLRDTASEIRKKDRDPCCGAELSPMFRAIHGGGLLVLLHLQADEGGNHGAVGALNDERVGSEFGSERDDFCDDLFNSLGRFDFGAGRFEARGLFHVMTAFGDESDNLTIEAVDIFANLFERAGDVHGEYCKQRGGIA